MKDFYYDITKNLSCWKDYDNWYVIPTIAIRKTIFDTFEIDLTWLCFGLTFDMDNAKDND